MADGGIYDMNIKLLTKYMIVLFVVGLILYDVYAYIQGGQEGTVSYLIITEWSRDYPAFTLGMGFVMGHLFWPLYREKQ